MKMFAVVLCVFISHAVSANNFTKPTFPSNSSRNQSTEDDQTNTSDLDLAENDNPSDNSVSGNDLQNLFSIEITGEPPRLDSLYDPDRSNANNDPQRFHFLNQYRGEGTKGQSSYKRVFVGKDSSGSEIYTSSPKIEHAVSLAENIRVGSGGLKILKNRRNVQTEGNRLLNPIGERSTKHKRSSSKKHKKRKVSKSEDSGNSSEYEAFPPTASSMSLSRQMILNPELRCAYDDYMHFHRAALNMVSLNEHETLQNMLWAPDFELPGPSGLRMQSDTLASEQVRPEISHSRPRVLQELRSESSYSNFSRYSSTRLEALDNDDTESRIDNSLNHFVAAVNALLTLVECLDLYFGSARRLRTSLLERPQESFNILEEISSYLRIMTSFSSPLAATRLGTDSENRLIDVTDSVTYVNEEIWGHIIDFRNDPNRDEDRGLVQYLMAILRQFRNEVTAVIESAQLVMEYFQERLNS